MQSNSMLHLEVLHKVGHGELGATHSKSCINLSYFGFVILLQVHGYARTRKTTFFSFFFKANH